MGSGQSEQVDANAAPLRLIFNRRMKSHLAIRAQVADFQRCRTKTPDTPLP